MPGYVTTFLAVVLGGLLTYATQWRLDRARRGSERERDEAAADRQRQRDQEAADLQRQRDQEAHDVQRQRDQEAADRQRERDDETWRRELAREQTAFDAEMRVALRLFLEELDTLYFHHQMLAREGRFPQEMDAAQAALFFPTNVWEAHKTTLARGFSDEHWGAITPFIHTIPRVRAFVLAGEPLTPIPGVLLDHLRDGEHLAYGLYEILADTPPPTATYAA